ncbi:unnamed protein product [Polarella glacialis]|uniref:Phospholipid scramblase n=1 Tax=Polarella glacialis TaxID=89957 RepID=A0A813K1L0_POLGL|nr:unnamed protein product [Polarella glacialis]
MQMVSWQDAVLSVGGFAIFANGTDYQYKLPFTFQSMGKLSRIDRRLLCCDKTICSCLNKQGAMAPAHMDMIDQDTGEQVRYQREKPRCCGLIKPRMLVYHNGQKQGSLAKTTRIFNRCHTCMEDLRNQEIQVLSLHDENGELVGNTVRPGAGCCLTMYPSLPMRCMPIRIAGSNSSAFVCVACTMEAWPSPDRCTGMPFPFHVLNGQVGWGCIPHGCLSCDPICCQSCVRGPKPFYRAVGFPLVCFCCPLKTCCISCPMISLKRSELPITSTFRYEDMDIKFPNREERGRVQFQFRGNSPSAYTHDASNPFNAVMSLPGGQKVGILASAIMMARSHSFGLPEPLLEGVPVTGQGPDFDGWVTSFNTKEILALEACLDEHNLVVQDCQLNDTSLKGYTLFKIGYSTKGGNIGIFSWGGTEVRKPVSVMNKVETSSIIANGKKNVDAITWKLCFYMMDPEQEILTRRTGGVDKTFKDWHITSGLQEVSLECTCVRVCKFPFSCTRHESKLCQAGLGKTVFKQMVVGHFSYQNHCLNMFKQ